MKRTSRPLLALALVLALVSACSTGTGGSPGSEGEPKRGGTISVAIAAPPAAPDPITVSSSGQIIIVQQVVEYLLHAGDEGEIEPMLATEYEPRDGARVWDVTLREGVVFHDGSPLTAKDVVASFERIVADGSKSSSAPTLDGILSPGGVKARGSDTVRFVLDRPTSEFPQLISSGNVGTGILKADYGNDFVKNPIGTGPFTLDSYRTNVAASFSRFADYWAADEVYLDKVDMRFYQDLDPATSGLLTGDVDLIYSVNYMDNKPLYDNEQVDVLQTTVSGGVFVQMRTDMEPWDDRRVRQAFAYSINRPEQAELLNGDPETVGNDGLWTSQFAEEVDVPAREYDPDKARDLLAEAGYPDGIEATMTITSELSAPAELMQSQVKAGGFDITLDVMDDGTYYSGPWLTVPLGISVWATRPSVSQLATLLYGSDSPWNSAHWENEEFDSLVKDLSGTSDEGERSEIAQQIDELLASEVPLIRAVDQTSNQAVAKSVHGYQISPFLGVDLVGVWVDG